MSQRLIIDCTPIKDEMGRTLAPVVAYVDLTQSDLDQADKDALEATAARTVMSDAAVAKSSDLSLVREAGISPLLSLLLQNAFMAIWRLLGGK
jgi:hypothetical protein